MSYLITVLSSALLLITFLLLTWFEKRRGTRLFAGTRSVLDKQVARVSFIVKHIDWGGFITHVVKLTLERVAHDVVHITLLVVRSAERTLTGMIRTLRERVATRSTTALPAEGSPFVATIVKFRKNLRKEQSTSTSGPENGSVEQLPG